MDTYAMNFLNYHELTVYQELMLDPVLVPESGNSYERAHIEAWLTHSMSVTPALLLACKCKKKLSSIAKFDTY